MSAAVTAVVRAQLSCTRWCCHITAIAASHPPLCHLTTPFPLRSQHAPKPRSLHTTTTSTPPSPLSAPQLLSHLSNLASPSSPIRGTAFEHTAFALLTALPLRLSLTHTGRTADQGVDLLGALYGPGVGYGAVLRLVGQCKMEGRVTGAAALRGLEGTVGQYASPNGGGGGGVVGVLVSAQPYTPQAEAQWRRSALPLLLVSVDTQAAHAIAESDGAERMQMSELQEALLRCLRRFSLNPAAAAALPYIRVVKQTLGTAQPYIAVRQAA